jgi:hypothetical protein
MLEYRERQRAFLVALTQVVEVRRTLIKQRLALALMDKRVPCGAQVPRACLLIMRNDPDISHRSRKPSWAMLTSPALQPSSVASARNIRRKATPFDRHERDDD